MIGRITKIGKAERVRVAVLLREMRRYLRAHGTVPRIESDDFALLEAWSKLGAHLERNVKAHPDTCRNGHVFSIGNTRSTSTGGRECVACGNTRRRERRARGAA